MIPNILLYIAIAVIITWLIVWFLRKREKKAKLNTLKAQLASNDLAIKKGSVRYEWVAFAQLDDDKFKDMDVSAAIVNNELKLVLDADNLTEIRNDNSLLRQLNESLHHSNNDFDQQILSLEDDKKELERNN